MSRLDELSRGFRRTYLDHDSLLAQVRAWSDAFPHLVRATSIGTTEEGRDIPLLVVGKDPDRARPGVWVDGNMHAMELAGSSAALAVAEDVLACHLDEGAPALPRGVRERVKDALFYVLPRMSPDGAEAVLKSGRYVRSRPHDARSHKGRARWRHVDVDGDGLCLHMRRQDPAGDFVEGPRGLMLARTVEDEGPFY